MLAAVIGCAMARAYIPFYSVLGALDSWYDNKSVMRRPAHNLARDYL